MSLYAKNSSSGAVILTPEGKSGKPESLKGRKTPGRLASVAVLGLVLMAAPVLSQTTSINLGTQGRNPDFSTLPFTRPVSVGTALPSTCQIGQLFFNSAAAAGTNLYGCTALNTWTVLSGVSGTGSSNASGGGATTGNGIGSLSGTSLSFGNQTVSTTSAAQPIILSNTGSGALTISGVTVSGTNAGDFAQGNNCGSSLGIGMTCTIAITFTPSTTAAESATVTVTDNGTGSPHTISVTGTGTAVAAGSGPAVTPAALSTTIGNPLTLTANKSVTWALAAGSPGTLTSNGTTAVYTPPSSIPAPNAYAGCMVAPGDSVFNTRIDNLPVNSQSATWMSSFINPISFLVSWGTNVIDNTLATTPLIFHYTPAYNGNWQVPQGSNRFRETGSLTVDGNNDHHLVSVNHQTCTFTETYQDGMPVANCTGCNTASGYRYASNSYTMPTQGTTDAAGLPLSPLTIHLSEIKSGAIKHAMRFTLCTGCINSLTYLWPATGANGSSNPSAPPMGARFRMKSSFVPSGVFKVNLSNGGSGYTVSPAVTFTGCQVAPSATAMISGGTVSSVNLNTSGSGCVNPTVSFGGPGSGAAATTTTFTATAQVILTGLQQYGMFLADNGMSGDIEVDSDLLMDPNVSYAIYQIDNAGLGASYFEVVDESSLMLASSSSQVNPTNGYVTPPAYAVVTATDGQGNKTSLPVALQPVLVGVPYPKMTILAGMSAYQMQAWVNGSSNQNVTWTVTSGPGTITTGGSYTPPATVTGPTDVVLTATAAADPTASTNVFISVIPPGSNPTNAIRIDVGSDNTYTDSQGNTWLPDLIGWQSGSYSTQNDNYPTNAWNIADQTLYQTYRYTWGDDIQYGPFVVPNGNYKVGFESAVGGCSGTFSETNTFDSGLINGPVDLEANGIIGLHFDIGKQVNYQCRVPYTAFIPVTVTNNVLFAAMRVTGGNGNHSIPLLGAIQILPDTTAAHLAIDTNYTSSVTQGSLAQFYAIGWYMSNAVTWSVSGGGSIDQTGLYTAPATVASNTTVTITATSQSNSSVSASVQITVIP